MDAFWVAMAICVPAVVTAILAYWRATEAERHAGRVQRDLTEVVRNGGVKSAPNLTPLGAIHYEELMDVMMDLKGRVITLEQRFLDHVVKENHREEDA